MQSVENKAIDTYQKNLEYFSSSHKELFNKLTQFNLDIENGLYHERYALDYIDGYFDVKQLSTGHYLYVENSLDISKKLTDNVNYKKDSFTFEGFPLYNFSSEALKNLDDKSKGMEGILPIMNYYIENVKNHNIMKAIEKYIFIGVGLGIHIELTHNKIKSEEYFIIENDLELFRLSLFTTKYYELASQSKLYFSINDDENIFTNNMKIFLQGTFYNNRFLKYTHFPAHSTDKIKYIQNSLASSSFATFPYKTALNKFIRPLEYINDGFNILNFSKHLQNELFTSKPVLILTAGPSLQENLPFIRKNHDKFIIIAVSSLLKKLCAEKIKPDIVTHLDGFELSNASYEGFDAKEFLKDAIGILGPFSPYNINQYFNKQNIFRFEEFTKYFSDFGSITTPCVGSFSVLLSIIFDTTETYLLGLDLALNQETGATHTSDHISSNDKVNITDGNNLAKEMGLRKNIIPVKGNFSKTVYTTSLFHTSIQALYNTIPKIKKNEQLIYNLNDGAKIVQTIPLQVKDVEVEKYTNMDKKDLAYTIRETLLQHSRDHLNQDEILSMKKRLSNAKVVKEYLLEYKNSVSYSNFDKYLYDLLGVISNILHMNGRESDNLTHVYDNFFKYVLPLVVDLFNSKGIKNGKRHIKKFDSMIQKEMFEIQSIYENALEVFIETRV